MRFSHTLLIAGLLAAAACARAQEMAVVPAPVMTDPKTVVPGSKAVARRVTMIVSDLERSKKFFEALGFKEDRRTEVSDDNALKVFGLPAGTKLTFIRMTTDNTLSTGRIDGGTLGLAQVHNRKLKRVRDATKGESMIGMPILVFTTDGVDAIYERLKLLGADIISAPVSIPGGLRSMIARDPDGTRMEVTQVGVPAR